MQSLWMLCATFLFAIMAACVKLASDYYTTSEMLLCRGIFGILFILTLIRINGGSLNTIYARQHIVRGLVGVIALWLSFYAITMLPLATATTLSYMSPIWIAAILFVVGIQQKNNIFNWKLAGSIVLSFIGVTLLLRPSIHSNELFGGLIALFSGFLTAIAYLQVKKLSLLGEPEYRVVFYFSLTGAIAGLIGSVWHGTIPFWHTHESSAVLLMLTIGITATLAQMALTRAYRLGNTLITANLQYSGIVFTSLLSILIWSNTLDWLSWTGIAMIMISGIASTYYHQRAMNIAKRQALSPIPPV